MGLQGVIRREKYLQVTRVFVFRSLGRGNLVLQGDRRGRGYAQNPGASTASRVPCALFTSSHPVPLIILPEPGHCYGEGYVGRRNSRLETWSFPARPGPGAAEAAGGVPEGSPLRISSELAARGCPTLSSGGG